MTLSWRPAIADFLGKLGHTGLTGFEGLVAVLCEAATGQRFRLSASGQQTGQDARSEPGYCNRIKVEAKHYSKSALDLRELSGELTQAIELGPETDLWVLAASCPINDQHAAALEELGRKHDVEVLFLDLGNDDLPRMAVLMAAEMEALFNWIRQSGVSASAAALRDTLEAVKAEYAFPPAKVQLLRKLRSALLGFEAARREAAARFLGTIRHSGNAVAMFNQKVAIQDPNVQVVPRVAVDDLLVGWWKTAPAPKRGVVLGEEGTGKTWATMNWLAARVESGTMPIVLPFSAVAESIASNDTIESVLPRLLARWTGIGSTQMWSGRVARWFSDPGAATLFLIVVDGLNERPTVHWPSFFRTLDAEDWQRHVAVLVTDRPGHWHPSCAGAGLDGFQEVTIPGFSDWELEQALTARGISVGAIPHELQTLIRKPRYCELVCAHFQEMAANADFTVERLIWLDARYRSQLTRGPLTEAAFTEVIRNLALAYRNNPTVNLTAIQTMVPFADPERRIHQEIIDGGLLEHAPGAGATYHIEPTRLVFGLGMVLADDLRRAASAGSAPAELADGLARWFEPHPEMDLKVRTCGAALFHSLIDPTYPVLARRQLLRYWLSSRNWEEDAQSAFQDYVLRCPEDFICVAEEFWTSDRNLGGAQDFLAGAFLRHRDASAVLPRLAEAVNRWMGFVHPAGHPIVRDTPDREKRVRDEIAARLGVSPVVGPTQLLGETLEVIEDEALLRLIRLGFLVISAGSRMPFVRGLVRWAITAAVMGPAMEAEVADWVIRLTDDPIEPALLAEGRRLLMLNNPLAGQAAHYLLHRLDTAAARSLLEAHPLSEEPSWRAIREEHRLDPCKSWLEWSDEDCTRCMTREDIHPLAILNKLDERPLNPAYEMPNALVRRLMAALQVHPGLVRASLGITIEESGYREAVSVLASREPRALAEFLRAVVCTAPDRPWERLYPLCLWLPDVSLILGSAELKQVDLILRNLRLALVDSQGENASGPLSSKRIAEAFAFMATVPHLSSIAFFSQFVSRPKAAYDLQDFEPLFPALTGEDAAQALATLHSAGDDTAITRALWFLGRSRPVVSQADRDRILALAQCGNPIVRGGALRFARVTEDEVLGRQIVDTGCAFRAPIDSWDSRWGARVLIRFSSHLRFEDVAGRLHPADAGFALARRGNRPEEVQLYALGLDDQWQAMVAASDPALRSLPPICVEPMESPMGTEFPEFPKAPPRSITYKNPSTTWRTPRTSGAQSELLDGESWAAAQNHLACERVEALVAAWRTEALQWYGRDFSLSALRAVCQYSPSLSRRWVEPALSEGARGQLHRLRFGSFLAKLCPALLEYDPALGLRLWRVLRKEGTGPARLNTTYIAFSAPDNDCTDEARWQVITEAADDAALSQVTYATERIGRQQWLRTAIERLIGEPALWRRAKGLTLAALMDISVAEFDAIRQAAGVSNTWVDNQASWLRTLVRRHEFAKHWFCVFLNDDDPDVSWGAWQMVLQCADERLDLPSTWDQIKQDERAVHRYRAMTARDNGFTEALSSKKDREKTLFGIKTERGEVVPFLDLNR